MMYIIPQKVNRAKMKKKRPLPRWDAKIGAHTTINGLGHVARVYRRKRT